MPFIVRQEPFTCEHCHIAVEPLTDGKIRNHCPACLHCKHVDDKGPGDRASRCQGLMKPVGVTYSGAKKWQIIHECLQCKKQIPNIVAEDDNAQIIAKLNEAAF